MNLDNLLDHVVEIALSTGHFIKNERIDLGTDFIESKGTNNFVTYVDKKAEEELVDKLGKLLPEAGFIAEEGTSSEKKGAHNWIIDPLDGTTNYIHNVPPYAVSIGLMKNNEIILGVIYEIFANESFTAHIETGSKLDGKSIQVSKVPSVADALIATGFPYTSFTKINEFFKTMEYFMKNSHGLRRLGSAATDMAYVACGRYDAFYEYGLSPWDTAAGSIIISQAGGKVSDFSGGNDFLFGKELISSNEQIFEELKTIVRNLTGGEHY